MTLPGHDLSDLLAALKAGEMTDTIGTSLEWSSSSSSRQGDRVRSLVELPPGFRPSSSERFSRVFSRQTPTGQCRARHRREGQVWRRTSKVTLPRPSPAVNVG